MDPGRQESRSYSRNQRDSLEPGAEEEQAFQDAEEQGGAGTAGLQPAFEARERNQSLHQGLDKDRFHRRTRMCNQPARLDPSGWSHKLCAQRTFPGADSLLR